MASERRHEPSPGSFEEETQAFSLCDGARHQRLLNLCAELCGSLRKDSAREKGVPRARG